MKKMCQRVSNGFTLIEVLVVIAVIGVLAGVAVSAFTDLTERTRKEVINQNAQSLATTFSCALAAGATFQVYDKNSVIDALTNPAGVHGRGQFAAVVFRCPMGPSEIADLKNSTTLESDGSAEGFKIVYTGPVE